MMTAGIVREASKVHYAVRVSQNTPLRCLHVGLAFVVALSIVVTNTPVPYPFPLDPLFVLA